MLAIFSLFVFSKQIDGGWETISVQSKEVNYVRNYLYENIQILFPEIEDNDYIIESAKHQIVAGMNLQLLIKTTRPRLSFVITLHINPQGKIAIKNISKGENARPVFGGYVWHDVSHISNPNIRKLVQGTIIVYRTKIERGLRIHVIYRTPEQKIYSAVFATNLQTKNEELVYIYEIQ